MEISAMSKALRQSIKHMPKYYRYNVGDRIINLLLDIKLCVKLLYVKSYLGLMKHYKSYKQSTFVWSW